MSAGRPKRLEGGELLLGWLNGLLDWVGALATIRVGEGLSVTQTQGGTVISLVRGPVVRYPARIMSSPGDGAAILPSLAVYTARALKPHFDTIAITTPRVPDYGRPAKGDAVKIWPWKVGTYCEIIVRDDPDEPGAKRIELEVPVERINFGPCAPPAAAALAPPTSQPPVKASQPDSSAPRAPDAAWPDSLLRALP